MKRSLFYKTIPAFFLILTGACITGCILKKEVKPPEADALETIVIQSENDKEEDKETDNKTEDTSGIEKEQALTAVKNYCHANNPDLEKIEESGEYPVYWDIESYDEDEIVVLFRSYTGAEIRYHIDPDSGNTYVTEFVPGITPKEERTQENFNVKDFSDPAAD